MVSRKPLFGFAAIVCLAVSVAFADEPKGGDEYADRWVYASRRLDAQADVDFYASLVGRMQKLRLNGLLMACGLEHAWRWDDGRKQRFLEVKKICDASGVEIIPIIWSVGYGTMVWVEPELVESEPINGVPYVVKNGALVFDGGAELLQNADLEINDVGKNRATVWWHDQPGSVSFVDKEVAHSGCASIRMEPSLAKNKYGHARLAQTIAVETNRHYRLSTWLRAEDFRGDWGAIRMQAYVHSPTRGNISSASHSVTKLEARDGWRQVSVDFTSGDATNVTCYVGTWGGEGGKLWIDDCSCRAVGLREVCLRPGTPFTVRDASGRVYTPGRDYILPKPRLEENCDVRMEVPAGSSLKEGARVLVDAYVVARHGPNHQLSTCMSDPRLFPLFEKSARAIEELCSPRKWFLSVDEVRNGGTCPLCEARHTDMAHIFGETITRMHGTIRAVHADAEIYAWSDMFDPNHNCHDGYEGTKGTFAGVCELIPKDIVMACWYRDQAAKTVPYFTSRGFRVLAAGYYDAKNADCDQPWLDALRATDRATGWMYTTWRRQYDLLEPWVAFMLRTR